MTSWDAEAGEWVQSMFSTEADCARLRHLLVMAWVQLGNVQKENESLKNQLKKLAKEIERDNRPLAVGIERDVP